MTGQDGAFPADIRAAISAAVADDTLPAELRRRASALHCYAEGGDTADAAQASGLSESRARYWRKAFERHGASVLSPDFHLKPARRRGAGYTAADPAVPAVVELDATERDALAAIAADASRTDEIRRRARIVLAYADGRATDAVARAEGLSDSRARFWRTAFLRARMGVFPEKAVPPTEPAPHNDGSSDGTRALRATDTMATAGRLVLDRQLTVFLRLEEDEGFGEDAEVVHRMRVAVRRMRAAADLFAEDLQPGRRLRRGLRRLGRALGEVRDRDVLLEHMRAHAAALPPADRAHFDAAVRLTVAERDTQMEALRALLASRRHEDFRARMRAFVDAEGAAAAAPRRSAARQAPLRILELYLGVRSAAPTGPATAVDDLHELRIRLKKLRYAIEFFAEILGPTARKALRGITALQDHLGDIQDAETASLLLTPLVPAIATGTPADAETRVSAAPLLAYLALREERKHTGIVTFQNAWEQFERSPFRKRLVKSLLTGAV